MQRLNSPIPIVVGTLMVAVPVYAKDEAAAPPGRETWCADSGTWCFNPEGPVFNGVRIVAEPKLGWVIPTGDDKLKSEFFTGAVQMGIEANVWGGIVAVQGMFLAPFTSSFDSKSPVLLGGGLVDSNGEVGVESGVGGGASFLFGIAGIGVINTHLDRRDFTDPSNAKVDYITPYVNLQPISAARLLIQSAFHKQEAKVDDPGNDSDTNKPGGTQ